MGNAHRAKATSNISLETELLFMILCYISSTERKDVLYIYILATFGVSLEFEDVSVLVHALYYILRYETYPSSYFLIVYIVGRCVH